MARIRRTTVQAFLRKYAGQVQLRLDSAFDGMTDGVTYARTATFKPAISTERNLEHSMGLQGVWFVGDGRDYITPFESDTLTGYSVYNCCGSFILAIPKAALTAPLKTSPKTPVKIVCLNMAAATQPGTIKTAQELDFTTDPLQRTLQPGYYVNYGYWRGPFATREAAQELYSELALEATYS